LAFAGGERAALSLRVTIDTDGTGRSKPIAVRLASAQNALIQYHGYFATG